MLKLLISLLISGILLIGSLFFKTPPRVCNSQGQCITSAVPELVSLRD